MPFVAAGHVYAGLVHLLLRHPGRFRRVLAYCNTVAEAKLVQRAFEEVGMEAWHINAGTNRKQREETIQAFCGRMQKPAHVLVTVQVLGEGVNIPNADTCMFVEPRDSYTSIVQAVGRVLRQHAAKPLAHIILPAVTMPAEEGTLAGGLKEAGLMSSSSDVVTCIPAGSYGQASDAHPLNRSLLVGSATAFRKASPLSDPAYEKPYRMIDSSSKSQHIHPAIHKLASGMLEGEFARKSDSQARAKGSQQAFRNIGGTVLHSPAHGPHNERAEDEYEQNLRTLDGSGSSSAEARALARASTASRKPSHSWTGDTQDPEQRVEDMLADTHMPNSARARAGSDNINDSVVTSSTVESALPSPEAMQRREAVSAAPLRQHVATHHRMKLSRVPDAQRDRSGFSQLERFLSVLGRADSRLAVPHSRMLGSRIWLVNCGSSAGFDTASVQSWLRLLAPILANPDPFEARVLQLEDFVEKHGRLPFPGRPPPEKQLSVWLKNTGYLIRQGSMASQQKLERLLASPASLVHRRAREWQTGSRLFHSQLSRLQEYMDRFQSLPSRSAKRGSEARQLSSFLVSQRNLFRRDLHKHESRKQALKSVHPLVEKFLDVPYRSLKELFSSRCLELRQYIDRVGQLPRPSASSEELRLWRWLWGQRRKLHLLSAERRAKLYKLHPLVTSFLRRAVKPGSSKLVAAVES